MEQFAPLLLERFGADWLKAGTMSVHFRNATLSGQPVRAFLRPVNPDTRFADLWMENEAVAGLFVKVSPLPANPAPSAQSGSDWPHNMEKRQAPCCTPSKSTGPQKDPFYHTEVATGTGFARKHRPIEAYASGVLPANLAIDALRAVEPHLIKLPSGCVGLYGSIELQVFDGPIKAGTNYTCNGEVLCIGQTPRTETLWYSSELLRENIPVARLLMMSRIMQLDQIVR